MPSLSHPKRFLALVLLAISVFTLFLLFSRIPDLQAKTLSTPSDAFSGLIAHEILLWTTKNDPWFINLGKHILNWLYANYKGMIFGIFLGGVAKCLFRYLQFSKSHNPFLNALMGLIAGTPLSVCVNCAAPIMKGALSSRRKSFALSMMISSPSLNFIVLSMLFTIFPLYLAFSKVFFNLLVILLIVPMIAHKLDDSSITPFKDSHKNKETENWYQALTHGSKELFLDLKFIFIKTAPLMLLAAVFAGSLALLVQIYEPKVIPADLLTLSLVALVGILLPLPIAMDILLAGAFFSIGVDTSVVLVLLFTLGISSVYSFAIVWKSLSPIWSISLFLSIFFLTLVIAPVGKIVERAYITKIAQHYGQILQNLVQTNSLKEQNLSVQSNLAETSQQQRTNQEQKPVLIARKDKAWKQIGKQKGFILYTRPFEKQPEAPSIRFSKLEGPDIGLIRGYEPSPADYVQPLWNGRGIAAGDLDQDGWEDLVLGSNKGPHVYKNLGGKFQLQKRPQNLDSLITFSVALVDLNNDNFPELFFTTLFKGNYVVPNKKGTLRYDLMKQVPGGVSPLTWSIAFADFDKNGYLDVVNGNSIALFAFRNKGFIEKRKNTISYNHNLHFRERFFKNSFNGDTDSILVNDLNRDGLADIFIANDFARPAIFHRNKGHGNFKTSPLHTLGIDDISYSPMSYNFADLDNDLIEDLFLSGTIGDNPDNYAPSKKYTQEKFTQKTCSSIKGSIQAKRCHKLRKIRSAAENPLKTNYRFNRCFKLLKEPAHKEACLANVLFRMTLFAPVYKNSFPNCDIFPEKYKIFKELCQFRLEKELPLRWPDFKTPGENGEHHIYKGRTDGTFQRLPPTKEGQRVYPNVTGWSWNSQIFDADNDGLQDIFLVNGSYLGPRNGPNYFFKGDGKSFQEQTFQYNLNDQFNYYSFVPTDFDNDGDLDIIVNSSEGPIRIYKNHNSSKNSLNLVFESRYGNQNFVSTKVILREKEKGWTRRIQYSGGFLSFPSDRLYFGLGKGEGKLSAEIIWPSGGKTFLKHKLQRGMQYRIVSD